MKSINKNCSSKIHLNTISITLAGLLLSFGLNGCSNNDQISVANEITPLSAVEKQETIKTSKEVLKGFMKTFKPTLKAVLKDMKAPEAITMCTHNQSVNNYSKTLAKGISLRRITLKERNENHTAQNKLEEQTLKEMDIVKKPIIKKVSNNHIQFYKPLIVKQACLKCHGSVDQIGETSLNLIKKNYPNDKATGYKVGDVRGVFLVDIIK